MTDLSRQIDKFVKQNIDHRVNNYSGLFLSPVYLKDIVPYLKNASGDTSRYFPIVTKFFVPGEPGVSELYEDLDIIKLTTEKDLIINNKDLFIFFTAGLSVGRSKSLRLHLIENFLANWEPYSDLINYDIDNITITSLSGIEICRGEFDKDNINYDDWYSDIQFLLLSEKSNEYKKGVYNEIIESHINQRLHRGLVTIIFYSGLEQRFDETNFIYRIDANKIKRVVNLTEKEKEEAEKAKQAYNNNQDNNNEKDKQEEPSESDSNVRDTVNADRAGVIDFNDPMMDGDGV